MAFKKIRELDASTQLPGGSLSTNDLLAAADVNGNKTVKVTPQEIIGTSLGGQSSLELDSNGKLMLREGSINSENIAPAAITAEQLAPGAGGGASSNIELTDNTGTVQSLNEATSGFIAVWATNDGGVDNTEEGPNPRDISSSQVNTSTNRITVPSHGLETDQKITFSGSNIPQPLVPAEEYKAHVIDGNTIQVKTTTGNTVDLTTTGGNCKLNRDIFVAFDALDWLSDETSGNYSITLVNFKFKYVSQAYRWFVRYAGVSKLILLAGAPGDASTMWSDVKSQDYTGGSNPLAKTFDIGGGRNFEYLTQLDIQGYRGTGANKTTGGTQTAHSHAALSRARIVLNLRSDDWLPIWFRIFGSVYISNVCFDYKVVSGQNVDIATMMRCSHGLYSFNNIAFVMWDSVTMGSNYGTTSGYVSCAVALEGGTIYWLAGSHYVFGAASLAVVSSIGLSSITVGTPNIAYFQIHDRTVTNGTLTMNNRTFRSFEATTISENITLFLDGTFGGTLSFGNPSSAGTTGSW